MSRTVERRVVLPRLLDDPGLTLTRLVQSLLEPPLYSSRAAFPTVYTAVYYPTEQRVDYLWPGKCVGQRLDQFEPGEYMHDYSELTP